jgi:hypothetical protein
VIILAPEHLALVGCVTAPIYPRVGTCARPTACCAVLVPAKDTYDPRPGFAGPWCALRWRKRRVVELAGEEVRANIIHGGGHGLSIWYESDVRPILIIHETTSL